MSPQTRFRDGGFAAASSAEARPWLNRFMGCSSA
jgi:hypothetical protein